MVMRVECWSTLRHIQNTKLVSGNWREVNKLCVFSSRSSSIFKCQWTARDHWNGMFLSLLLLRQRHVELDTSYVIPCRCTPAICAYYRRKAKRNGKSCLSRSKPREVPIARTHLFLSSCASAHSLANKYIPNYIECRAVMWRLLSTWIVRSMFYELAVNWIFAIFNLPKCNSYFPRMSPNGTGTAHLEWHSPDISVGKRHLESLNEFEWRKLFGHFVFGAVNRLSGNIAKRRLQSDI